MDHQKREMEFDALPADVLARSLWSQRFYQVFAFYCPLCQHPRKIPFRARPGGWRHLLYVYAATTFLTLVTWPWFGLKGLVAAVPIWAVFEVVYRFQLRAALRCRHCGFDPVLYLVDVKRARAEVEAHYRSLYEARGIPFPDKNKGVKKSVPVEASSEDSAKKPVGDSSKESPKE